MFRDDADADEDEYSVHDENEENDDDDDDDDGDEEEEKPSVVDATAAVLDKSLYLQDTEDLDDLKE